MSRVATLTIALLLLARPAAGEEDEAPPTFPTLAAMDAVDPLERARAFRGVDPREVLAALGPDANDRDRLRAIHAAPLLEAPDETLPLLVAIAGGDDPLLAPAAASAAVASLHDLGGAELAASEVDLARVGETATAFVALADDEHVRPDIRAAAARVAGSILALTPAPTQLLHED